MEKTFIAMFGSLALPVIVCENNKDWPVVYMNPHAGLLLAPTYSVNKLIGASGTDHLYSIVNFINNKDYDLLRQIAANSGYIEDFHTEINTFEQSKISAALFGVNLTGSDGKDYFVLYVLNNSQATQNEHEHQVSVLLTNAFMAEDVDLTINNVLNIAGRTAEVSRVYVFEETSPTMTANTYEWCAANIAPAIQDLQNLPKEDYNFDVIVNSGMYITDDVSRLPADDREILEMQGIKSLAIITLYDKGHPFGYCGFDDCERTRNWSNDEIQYLKSISALLSALLIRRNAERRVTDTLNILQLISDASKDIMYANDIEEYNLLFVNRALAESLGKTPEQLIGKKCYHMLHKNQTGPCDFCPIPKVKYDAENQRSEAYTWEVHNDIVDKTYLATDTLVRWTDGRLVHTETAVDISRRIANEQQLRYYASTDVMTGISNREWGANTLTEKLSTNACGSLVFLDIDGLKMVNDTYGHAAGDTLLKTTVQMVLDHVGEEAFFCRWGGDEFLLWLPQEVKAAQAIINNILAAMHTYNQTNHNPFILSFSYGIVPFAHTEGKANLDALVTSADQLMYAHKMDKRGRLKRRRRGDAPQQY